MPKYDDEMKGVLFPAEKKHERSPDYTGRVKVNGEEYRLAAWSRISKAGNDYLSIAVSIPREQQESKPDLQKPFVNDDEIPF